MLAADQLAQKIGRKVLFVGVEAYRWQIADFEKAAKNARALGFDTLCIKRADGGIKWYQTPGHLALERQACLAQGVGFLPFFYSYGPRFGNAQIDLEVQIARELAGASDGLVCIDMEVEWNGQSAAAQYLAEKLQNFPGDIILSTWADPVQQNWNDVLGAIAPVMSAVSPQQYTNWLTTQEGQLTQHLPTEKIFPALDVVDLFGGANSPLDVLHMMLSRNHRSYWVWEYQGAMNNPTLMHTMTALIGGNAPTVASPSPTGPTKLPSPQHTKRLVKKQYTVTSGDSLSAIAQKLGLQNWFQDIYIPNRDTIENTAHVHGNANSQNGAIIYPGEVLTYNVME